MRSKKHDSSLEVSLFPMFNILVCTLGVLLFILTSISGLSLGILKTLDFSNLSGSSNPKEPMHLDWDGSRLKNIKAGCEVYFDKDIESDFSTYSATFDYIQLQLNGTGLGDSIAYVRKNRESRYFLVFIRPSGFDNFLSLKGFLQQEKVDIGYEPVEQYVTIKL